MPDPGGYRDGTTQGTVWLQIPTLFQGFPPPKLTGPESVCFGWVAVGGVVSKKDLGGEPAVWRK